MATDTQIISAVKTDVSWIKAHERILIVFMLLIVFGWLGNKYLDKRAAETALLATAAQTAAKESQSQAALAAQTYKVTLDAMQTEIAALNRNVVQRTVILQAKQEVIKTSPVPEVTAEWQRLLGTTGEIIPRIDGAPGAQVTENVARTTVSQLESIPSLQGNLTDQTQITQDTRQSLDKADALVLSLNSEILKNDASCKAQLTDAKAVSNKSKRNWFIAGFVAGIATRILGKF